MQQKNKELSDIDKDGLNKQQREAVEKYMVQNIIGVE